MLAFSLLSDHDVSCNTPLWGFITRFCCCHFVRWRVLTRLVEPSLARRSSISVSAAAVSFTGLVQNSRSRRQSLSCAIAFYLFPKSRGSAGDRPGRDMENGVRSVGAAWKRLSSGAANIARAARVNEEVLPPEWRTVFFDNAMRLLTVQFVVFNSGRNRLTPLAPFCVFILQLERMKFYKSASVLIALRHGIFRHWDPNM